jgi:tRNA (guanine37-N1)-methyltransferase
MQFDLLSLFPESFASYLDVSILKRAREDGKIKVETWNIRDFTHDKHHTADDTPYGGGAGMVMKPEPIFECVEAALTEDGGVPRERTRVILFSAKGKAFTQADARRFAAEYDRLVLICGRYEGVDERVAEHLVDEELSVGEYVLTGGELPAMIVTDAVARLIPGVLGNAESVVTESHSEEGVLECPQYTKPEEYRGYRVPDVLLSGHHAEIDRWRKEHSRKVLSSNT